MNLSTPSKCLRLLLLLAFTSVVARGVAEELPAALRGVHRILFLGDSITQDGNYVVDFDCWLVAHRSSIEVLNMGLASETASDLSEAENHAHKRDNGFGRPFLSQRLDRVLTETRPDLLIACYGMNDGGNLPADASGTRRFGEAITALRAKALNAGVKRVVICTPPVQDAKGNVAQRFHDENLARYSVWLLSKRKEGWDVVDLHGPMRKALDEGRAKDPTFAFAGDGVHPGREGHWLMATSILEQFLGVNLPPISRAELLLQPNGEDLRKLVAKRMRLRFSAWMSKVGHSRPGVPGGPGSKPGLSVEEAQAQASEITRQITEALVH